MRNDGVGRIFTIGNLIFVISLVFFVWLVYYFYTGAGGALELAVRLIPFAVVLQVLLHSKQGYLYKRLPPVANHVLVVLYRIFSGGLPGYR